MIILFEIYLHLIKFDCVWTTKEFITFLTQGVKILEMIFWDRDALIRLIWQKIIMQLRESIMRMRIKILVIVTRINLYEYGICIWHKVTSENECQILLDSIITFNLYIVV